MIIILGTVVHFLSARVGVNWGGGWLLGGDSAILTAKRVESQISDVGLLCAESNQPQMFDQLLGKCRPRLFKIGGRQGNRNPGS